MKYTPKFFRDTMPEWKRKKDSIIARYIHRPISFIFSSVFAEMGLTPNQVSFISLIIAFIASGCFLSSNRWVWLLGALLVNLWSIIDSADGNMARSLGGKPYGEFIDATSSYVLVGFMFPAMGYAIYKSGGIWIGKGDGLIVLVGAVAGISDTMMRLFFQKMKNDTYELMISKGEMQNKANVREGRIAKLQTMLESELGLGGWNMIAIIACSITSALDIYVLFYLLYNGGMFIASTIYLILKTKCLKR